MSSVGGVLSKGSFNIVFGGQAGSEGKGKIACKIAFDYLHENNMLVLSCNHMPNAGHTFRFGDFKYVARQLPTPAVFNNNKVFNDKFKGKFIPVVLGPGSTINLKSLEEEIEICGLEPGVNLFIHSNAGIVTEEHLEAEGKVLDNVSSTKKGGGACLASKIMRQPITVGNTKGRFAIARDLLPKHLSVALNDTSDYLNYQMRRGVAVLHEGAQGFDLDINHGLDYPYVTSRMSNVSAMLAESGVSPDRCGSRIMVIRPYPIRVGDAYDEDGKMIGTSGAYAIDNEELDWDKIKKLSGAPDNVNIVEKTTVTGKIRRVFTFSKYRFNKSMMVNDPTHIFVTFADHIDYKLYNTGGHIQDDTDNVSDERTAAIGKIRWFVNENNIPGTMIMGFSTGPDNNDFLVNNIW